MRSWFHVLERVDAFDGAVVVGLEIVARFVDRRARADAFGDAPHLVFDAMQLFPSPRVGLVEIEIDAGERPGEKRVAVASDRVAGIGRGCVLVAEVRSELGVARGRELRRGCELGVVGALRGERAEEGICIALAAPRRRHLCTRERLAPRRDETLLHTRAE